MAQELAGWVDADPDWERMAPVPLATVCFRYRPAGETDEARLDGWNEAILNAINREGTYYLSDTRLGDRRTLRVALGNPRTEMRHLRGCWQALNEAARKLA